MSAVKELRQEQSVIFLHIPKTAGSTLNKIIDHQYKQTSIFTRHYFPDEFNDEFRKLPEERRKKIRVLKGHMFFGLHEYLPQPSTYITLLRDPVERIISNYYMILEDPQNIFHKDVTSKHMSLKDFVCSDLSDGIVTLNNGQARMLSGVEANTAGGFEEHSNEILELARINLKEHFIVAGLQEKFDETLILLRRAFGWRNIFYIKIGGDKPRPKKKDIPRETLNIIEKYNELDIELYKYAKERFDEQVLQQGPSFEKELREFRSWNKVYSKVYGNIYGFFRPMTRGFRRLYSTIRSQGG
jgi:hypothetical protein